MKREQRGRSFEEQGDGIEGEEEEPKERKAKEGSHEGKRGEKR